MKLQCPSPLWLLADQSNCPFKASIDKWELSDAPQTVANLKEAQLACLGSLFPPPNKNSGGGGNSNKGNGGNGGNGGGELALNRYRPGSSSHSLSSFSVTFIGGNGGGNGNG